jgi:hypothetical protein
MPRKKPPIDPPSADRPITTRERNRVERRLQAIEGRRFDEQDLGFCPREFVLCGLPYKRQKELKYERVNGTFTLKVVGDPDHGVPFGQDRLVPFWLATAFQAAGCPADNIIRFRSASDVLRAFQISPGGRELAMLKQRLERVFGATYFVRDTRKKKSSIAQSYRLMSQLRLWFDIDTKPNQYTAWQNFIQLSAEFADDLRRVSVPIDLQTVRGLKENPAALDLYTWQAWRSFRLAANRRQQEVKIPVFGEGGLLAQLGTVTSEPRRAKQLLRQWQGLVRQYWPECPNELLPDASALVIRPGVALNPQAPVSLPGVQRNPPVPLLPLDEIPSIHLVRDPEEDEPKDLSWLDD